MKAIYLDESGDHSLVRIDPSYPVFVLGGVVVDIDYERAVIAPELERFKRTMFGAPDLVLHTSDIVRNRRGFENLQDRDFREAFYAGLNALMRTWQYEVIACAIRKDEHLARYGVAALDPYMLSLNIVLERYCTSLTRSQPGMVIVEARSIVLDRQLQLAWEVVQAQGTQYMRGSRVAACIQGFEVRPKHENRAGLQLADLVVSPIGRLVLGKPPRPDWEIVRSKLRMVKGRWLGPGLAVLPKAGVRT